VTLLLIVTAVLLLTSGVVKLRAAERAGLGLPVLPLLELLVGLLLVGVSFASPLTPSQGLVAVVGSVALILFSSVRMWMQLRGLQRKRDLSESARLQTYVSYLSTSLGPDGAPRHPRDEDA
jgi:NhaP-type Na+/H+ or K+/H+ antiporter